MAYDGSIILISGIKQANNGTFPLVDAPAVRVTDNKRLDEALDEKQNAPANAGMVGQVLGLDNNLAPVWIDQGGESVIDDTAGDGVTDRAWSANKIVDELATKADKDNPVFTGAISKGRKDGTVVGTGSTADGNGVTARGNYSRAEGNSTTASGQYAHSEGGYTTASGQQSHSEGYMTSAYGNNSHAEGVETDVSGTGSHAEGLKTTASGSYQHVSGKYNVSDASSAEIIGNGTGDNTRSNARRLEWNGDEYLLGNLYVQSDATGRFGKKVATETYVDNRISDVRVNGTSILQGGIANVPVADNSNTLGVVKGSGYGVRINSSGELYISTGSVSNEIKNGSSDYLPIVPSNQHASAFYGLAKAAGDTSQASSSNAVGTYTDAAKDKIMKMIGVLDMIAPYESADIASMPHASGSCFIWNGKLFRAKTNIAIGESFTTSNCEQTTLIAEIMR